MTINQLKELNDDEIALALNVLTIIPPEGSTLEFQIPRRLTWIKHDVLVKKFIDVFPKLKSDGHQTYSSLLTKLGVPHEIKYEQPPLPQTSSII